MAERRAPPRLQATISGHVCVRMRAWGPAGDPLVWLWLMASNIKEEHGIAVHQSNPRRLILMTCVFELSRRTRTLCATQMHTFVCFNLQCSSQPGLQKHEVHQVLCIIWYRHFVALDIIDLPGAHWVLGSGNRLVQHF